MLEVVVGVVVAVVFFRIGVWWAEEKAHERAEDERWRIRLNRRKLLADALRPLVLEHSAKLYAAAETDGDEWGMRYAEIPIKVDLEIRRRMFHHTTKSAQVTLHPSNRTYHWYYDGNKAWTIPPDADPPGNMSHVPEALESWSVYELGTWMSNRGLPDVQID
jgi:hypothetical protein